jgi:CxxC motif-containing protein (DUF1111 family)
MKKIIFLFIATALISSCKKDDNDADTTTSSVDINSGGATTTLNSTSLAFEDPSSNLNAVESDLHARGNVAFEATFITAPATNNPGLGPLFNNTGCAACHIKNGRAPYPTSANDLGGLLIRVSMNGTDSHGGPLAYPGYGGQLQNRAVFGKAPEATVTLTEALQIKQFLDGSSYELREPIVTLSNHYTPLTSGPMLISPRIAPPIIGLGLLEAVSEQTLLALADESDANSDGISGKLNYVWDVQANSMKPGKFGWKAGQPNLTQQAAAAYVNDMGVTNPLFTHENSLGQPQDDLSGDDPEINAQTLEEASFYTKSVAVPARRNATNSQVFAGENIFKAAKCNACHRETMVTSTLAGVPSVSNQIIHPYTDLLLHDMGSGLADNRPEFSATGTEWRTPPLWGIGLSRVINGHTNFLHDGRARNLMEAIMWHGGEASNSANYVKALSSTQRESLVKFLESL